jgi:hypothetical protein
MSDDFHRETIVDRIDRLLIDAYGSNLNNLSDYVCRVLRDSKMEILRLKEIERTTKPSILREVEGEVPSPGHFTEWGKGKDE